MSRWSAGTDSLEILFERWRRMGLMSFYLKLRDELLNREIFTMLGEAKVLIGWCRREFNEFRPHSVKGNQPPAPVAI